MIIDQLLVIFFNVLFGAFFCLVLRIIDFFITNSYAYIVTSFLTTISLGIIYIWALDKYPPNFYNLVFLTLGFYIIKKTNHLNFDKYLFQIKLLTILSTKLLKKLLLFTINYSLIVKIKQKIKKTP